MGVIPSGQENHSRAEHLKFPGRELNVINFTEQYFLFKNIEINSETRKKNVSNIHTWKKIGGSVNRIEININNNISLTKSHYIDI